MSGTIAENPNRQSGTVGPIASATKDSGDPTTTTNPSGGVGAEWHNTTSGAIFICTDATSNSNVWVGQTGAVSGIGERGIWFGGANGDYDNLASIYISIDYTTIDTLGDSTVFGDMSTARYEVTGVSNGTNGRAVDCGGLVWYSGIPGGTVTYDMMEYVTISTLGNVTDLGNMTSAYHDQGGCSNATNDRGILWGGQPGSNGNNHIDYFTITSTANATDFGDMTQNNRYVGATDNGTDDRGVAMGGGDGSSNNIDYITISSTGNASDFGNLVEAINFNGCVSNSVNNRGVSGGGSA